MVRLLILRTVLRFGIVEAEVGCDSDSTKIGAAWGIQKTSLGNPRPQVRSLVAFELTNKHVPESHAIRPYQEGLLPEKGSVLFVYLFRHYSFRARLLGQRKT